MLARLRDQISECEEEAKLARIKAILAPSPEMRHEYIRLEQSWLQLQQTLRFATMISGFLEWRSARLPPPPS